MISRRNFTKSLRKTLGSRHVTLKKLEGWEGESVKVKDNFVNTGHVMLKLFTRDQFRDLFGVFYWSISLEKKLFVAGRVLKKAEVTLWFLCVPAKKKYRKLELEKISFFSSINSEHVFLTLRNQLLTKIAWTCSRRSLMVFFFFSLALLWMFERRLVSQAPWLWD